jgi:hypothetical protein
MSYMIKIAFQPFELTVSDFPISWGSDCVTPLARSYPNHLGAINHNLNNDVDLSKCA